MALVGIDNNLASLIYATLISNTSWSQRGAATLYVALLQQDPLEDLSAWLEITDSWYGSTRMQVTFPASSSDGSATNTSAQEPTWVVNTDNNDTIIAAAIVESITVAQTPTSTAGQRLIMYCPLPSPKVPTNGETIKFAAGDLSINFNYNG